MWFNAFYNTGIHSLTNKAKYRRKGDVLHLIFGFMETVLKFDGQSEVGTGLSHFSELTVNQLLSF